MWLMPTDNGICPFIEQHPDLFLLILALLFIAYLSLYLIYCLLVALYCHVKKRWPPGNYANMQCYKKTHRKKKNVWAMSNINSE